VTSGHVQREIPEAIGVRAPEERPDALEYGRQNYEADDLDPDRPRLQQERKTEEAPGQERKR
jgi:hypothetical protein